MTRRELEAPKYIGLLDLQSGELLSLSVDNAGQCLNSARAQKQLINEVVNEATAYLVELSEHQGTKTLHGERETITISGGTSIDYDPADLMAGLAKAGCPQGRIDAAVRIEISYKVDRAVLRQLAGANPGYKAAIELAEREIERPFRASVKLRRNSDDQ